MGFKWFVDGLLDGSVAFGGEESAGMSFLRRDGRPWSTDKDGIIACLLAAELTARSGRRPGGTPTRELTERFGAPLYRRIDARATPAQKAALGRLSATDVTATELAGDAVVARLTAAPGQRRAHRRPQGRHGARLVRGATVGHRGRHQALRRILRRRGAPGAHHR